MRHCKCIIVICLISGQAELSMASCTYFTQSVSPASSTTVHYHVANLYYQLIKQLWHCFIPFQTHFRDITFVHIQILGQWTWNATMYHDSRPKSQAFSSLITHDEKTSKLKPQNVSTFFLNFQTSFCKSEDLEGNKKNCQNSKHNWKLETSVKTRQF